MKKLLFLFAFVSVTLHSQTVYRDLTTAKAIAISQNKLILVDFTAEWCYPCKVMNQELWQSYSFKKRESQFVFVKIDIDVDRKTAAKYRANLIPRVLLITPNEDILYDEVGYKGKATYLKDFDALPKNFTRMNAMYSSVDLTKNIKGKPAMGLGMELSRLGQGISRKKLQNSFLQVSNSYLDNVGKKDLSEQNYQLKEATELLNLAYLGEYKKVTLGMEKIYREDNSLHNYILAYCYKNQGDKIKYQAYYDKIKSPTLLAKLD
ncbi:MAG: thioredoxin family protein [Flavobacteriaceae bacterium]